jgi:ubiquinone/menaquinone biosynthesis C-methylase UbiE
MNNIDKQTVAGFGDEWMRFDQKNLIQNRAEHAALWNQYFAIFPWQSLPSKAKGFDLGCGSGRWASLVAPRVGRLLCIDPSEAIEVARNNLREHNNCEFHRNSVDAMPMEDNSADFGYSLGVLHHIPDTEQGIRHCVAKLKPGAPLLIYLYYAFDNKPWYFHWLWKVSDCARHLVARAPYGLRYLISQMFAICVYLPLARLAWIAEKVGMDVSNIPLSAYRNLSMYTIRTDALDRFGTRMEKRFTKEQIRQMMERAGLSQIRFSDQVPYWCAVGIKDSTINVPKV